MQLKYIQDALAFISKNGYETNHVKLLKSTATFLAELFGVNYAIIDKISLETPSVLETVAFYGNGIFLPNMTYNMANTPCETIINNKFRAYPTKVKSLFPKDDFLVKKNIDSYIGIPLWSSGKSPMGLIALLDSKAKSENEVKNMEIILQIIAIKVEKILEKKLLEDELNLKTKELKTAKEDTEKIEEKFEAENKKLSVAVNQSPNSVVITDVNGNIEYTNPKFTEITGYTAAEVLGKNPRILSSGLQTKEFYAQLWQTITAGKTWSGEFQNKSKNGNLYWERTTITPIKNEFGKITSYLAIKEDISKNREAAEELKGSEEKYRHLFLNNPQPMWIYDIDTLAFLEINNAAIQHYGYTREEFLNMTIKDIRPKEDINALLKDVEHQRQDYYSPASEWRHIKKNGEIINVEIVTHAVLVNSLKARHVMVNDITASKKAKNALLKAAEKIKKSEKKFRELFEKSGDAILIIKNEIFTDCNQATVELLGYKTKEEFLNSHPSKLSPKYQPDGISSLKKAKEMINISLKKGTHRFEWIHTKSNGELFPVEVLLTAIENEPNNKVVHCVWRDITQRKKADEVLKRKKEKYRILSEDYLIQNTVLQQLSNELSEKNRLLLETKHRFENLFEHSPVSLWEQDFSEVIKLLNEKKSKEIDLRTYFDENPNFINQCLSKIKILNVNKITLNLLGVKNVNELKVLLTKTNNQKSLEVVKEELLSIASNNKIFTGETEFTSTSGKIISAIVTSAIIDDYGKAIASVIDISALKQAENKLKEIQYLLLESQKIANIGSYELDFSTGIWKSSPALNDIFGIDEGYDRNIKGWLGVVHPQDLKMMEQYFEINILKNKEHFNKEYRIIRNVDKQERWVHGMGEIEFDQQGNPKRLIGTIQDISEKKKILQEIIIAKEKAEESDRMKTEFIQNMSHEIRTPMNGILGFSDLLDNPELPYEKRKKFIEIIKNSTHQLLHIIDDLMEISVLETKQIKAQEQPVCLNDLLHELHAVFNLKAIGKKIALVLKNGLSTQESTVLTDKNKLHKVLANLLENALKFTNEGTVELGYKLKKDSEPPELEIYVKDSGIGIKPEKQKMIFERFSQAEKELSKKVGGLGLGLSIAKENAELLGGKLAVVSQLGEGALFSLTIPYKPFNEEKEILKTEEKLIPKEKHTILIAEDEDVNFMVLEILLVDKLKLSCTIIHAKNGLEAVDFIKSNPAIEIILMDIKMPKMDGHEATKIIKEIRPDLPIIAQTAFSSAEEKEKAYLAGCNDFISKPIGKEVLSTVLNNYLLAN